jgi:hypothetical protein
LEDNAQAAPPAATTLIMSPAIKGSVPSPKAARYRLPFLPIQPHSELQKTGAKYQDKIRRQHQNEQSRKFLVFTNLSVTRPKISLPE